MALHPFCPGYTGPFKTLVRDYPNAATFSPAIFRTEWGPIFHRGRLNGTARLLVIGQDPAAHENVARRVLVGEAGQRVQGFIARLGVGNRYVLLNTFLYSVYDSAAAAAQANAVNIAVYRNRWFAALLKPGSQIKAVVALGGMAEQAWQDWKASPTGTAAAGVAFVKITHPTADAHPNISTAQLLQNWNAGLQTLAATFQVQPAPYGANFAAADLSPIPEEDLPAGVPAWMRAIEPWADRIRAPGPSIAPPPNPADSDARYRRRHIIIEVPTNQVP